MKKLTKYYEAIKKAQDADDGNSTLQTFDLALLGKGGGVSSALLRSRLLHKILRRFFPVLRLRDLAIVTRYDDVRHVRENDQIFEAPYKREMQALVGGKSNFLLGMGREPQYYQQLQWIEQTFKKTDLPLIGERANKLASTLIHNSGGEIDVVEDLLIRVSAQTCTEYYGLQVSDYNLFARWLMSLSALLFADYRGADKTRQLALLGAENVRAVIRKSIADSRRRRRAQDPEDDSPGDPPDAAHGHGVLTGQSPPFKETILDRLLDLQETGDDNAPCDDDIIALLVGLSVGFVPTGAGAGGHIMEELLARPKTLGQVRKWARNGESDKVERCLMEALRFRPPIIPGLPRYTLQDVKIAGVDIPKGTVVIAAAMSAMFDQKLITDADTFNPERDVSQIDLNFGGDGLLHYCVGEKIARLLLTNTLQPLLACEQLHREKGKAGRIQHIGPFPSQLKLRFEPSTGHRHQSFITICLPASPETGSDEHAGKIEALHNTTLHDALVKTNRVHFAHISPVAACPESGDQDGSTITHIIIELCVDGDSRSALAAIAATEAQGILRELLRDITDMPPEAEFVEYLLAGEIILNPNRANPSRGQASGINFHGTPQLSVPRILADAQVAEQARTALKPFWGDHVSIANLGLQALAYARSAVDKSDLADHLLRPASQDLKVSRQENATKAKAVRSFFRQPAVYGTLLGVTAILFFLQAVFFPGPRVDFSTSDTLRATLDSLFSYVSAMLPGALLALTCLTLWRKYRQREHSIMQCAGFVLTAKRVPLIFATLALGSGWFLIAAYHSTPGAGEAAGPVAHAVALVATIWEVGIRLLLSIVLLLTLFMLVMGGFFALVRKNESESDIEDHAAPLAKLQEILRFENRPDTAQNHIIAVTRLKTNPRWLRRWSLALAFWSIKELVTHFFRPGFVLNMGTIHYARWLRIPGTDTLVFMSNYDGSWDSYLEDFITRASEGQSAVWSNGVGFPHTRFLVFEGAARGEEFKRWVRRQQTPTRFWFTRYPGLTTDQIRNNALITEGLARATTETEARAWVDLLGSKPHTRESLETSEIQSLVFGGHGRLPCAAAVPVYLSENPGDWREWLKGHLFQSPGTDTCCTAADGEPSAERRDDAESPPPLTFTFDEWKGQDVVINIALSPVGLAALGMDALTHGKGEQASSALDTFPAAFRDGMNSTARAHILGDRGESAPDNWSWYDDGKAPAFMLLIYARCNDLLEHTIKREADSLQTCGLVIKPDQCIRMQDLPDELADFQEPFGFKDGISQPIIRGTRRFYDSGNSIHVVEPGEMVLGYRDNRGQFPLTPQVGREHANTFLTSLPTVSPGNFPDFSSMGGDTLMDLGRNGTFLVMRQLEQDVDNFKTYLETQAQVICRDYKLSVTADWVGARLVGRWPDGKPLVRYPNDPQRSEVEPVDFTKLLAAMTDHSPTDHSTLQIGDAITTNAEDGEDKKDEEDTGRRAEIEQRRLRRLRDELDNQFLYGEEDPQGFRCPYGSHIRRANPRDSQKPEDSEQVSISNRHRILRRGRNYIANDDQIKPRGLLFMCLNADIERQFEFIQQTWLSSPNFHGLRNEPDPIAAYVPDGSRLTIPHQNGPLELCNIQSFVTVKNGGYFFMPGKTALMFLALRGGDDDAPSAA
ncbi:MAG: cytochrome P450 [Halioglobus sp.]|nr:cytochrome P450 [Halioglobus sp.]